MYRDFLLYTVQYLSVCSLFLSSSLTVSSLILIITHILSFPLLSYSILPLLSYPLLSLTYPILSLTYHILTYPILSYSILSLLSYPLLSLIYHILSSLSPIPSYPLCLNRASETTGVPVRIYAVEKNLHAVITLRNRAVAENWDNVRVIAKGAYLQQFFFPMRLRCEV